MKIEFKRYTDACFSDLVECVERLQDFIVAIDPLKRNRRLPAYGKTYARNLIKKVGKNNGALFLAYDAEKIVGCIAGIIEKQQKDDFLGYVPSKAGRILDFIVLDTYQAHGIGKELMKKMESYFKQNKCDIIRVEVFEPNKKAHNFYLKLNYQDRVIDMAKLLK